MKSRTAVRFASGQTELAPSGGSVHRAIVIMKTKRLLLTCLIGVHTIVSVEAQGTFQNLDFENGVFIPAPTPGNPFAVEWVPAMPGWTGFLGSGQQSVISYNALSLSLANIAIMGPDNPRADYMHGHYYVVLQNSFPTATDVPAIAQTGTIPADTASIRFYNRNQFGPGLGVYFAGQEIPIVSLGAVGNGSWMWGGDISTYAGQAGELRFRGATYLDNIFFAGPIPEPSAVSLFGLGALLLGWRFLCRRT